MNNFSGRARSTILKACKSKAFDVVIIGGGITGAGIFLDAQSRGLSCCLVEMQDFSEGTSSRSTRLIHGGLRYLKQWNFKLVSDTGRERTIVENIARHLTYPKKIVVPATVHGNFSKIQLGLALWIYELLAKVPKKFRHRTLSAKDTLGELKGLNSKDLLGAIEYVEFQTNDSRLTIENIKTAVNLGGIAVSRLKAADLSFSNNGMVDGVSVKDLLGDDNFLIKSNCVINATGAWADQFLSKKGSKIMKRVSPSKGIHLVFSKDRFNISKAVYFDTPDGRMIFAIPEEESVYVGTTDTFYDDDLSNLYIEKLDAQYLLEACNSMFPAIKLKPLDIVSGWVGVRPLIYEEGKTPSEISRRHEIFKEENGLLSIAGGKLTGYRKMAEKMTDLAVKEYFSERTLKLCNTKNIKLTGSSFMGETDFEEGEQLFLHEAMSLGWAEKEASWVFHHYGDQSLNILKAQYGKVEKLPAFLFQSLMFSLNNEMVLTASDFLIRRTNLFYFYPETVSKWKHDIVNIIVDFHGLNNVASERQEAEINNEQFKIERIKQLKEKDLESR